MNHTLKRLFALILALLAVVGLAACRGTSANEGETSTEASTESSAVTEHYTFSPTFVKEPLTHLIFGEHSYMQGDNLIGEIPMEALPQNFVSPMTLTVKDIDGWNDFYGGIPRHSIMNDDFTTALSKIDASFFESKFLVVIIVYEKSPSYTHEVTQLQAAEDKLNVTVTTNTAENAVQESAFRCIMIPVEKEHADLDIKVKVNKVSE